MRQFDIRFASFNSKDSVKPIMATVMEPDSIGPETGLMMFTHGWGNSRNFDLPKMEATCEAFNLVCVTTEYRQSGFAHDMQRGTGWDCPYDFSYFQVFDVLGAMRQALTLRPGLNRERFFHYGGSQGGHIALMTSVLAPKTFAAVYASCPITFVEEHFLEWAGRDLQPFERAYRDVSRHAEKILCPVYLEHGTEDVEVPAHHSRKLEERLKSLGKAVEARYIQGGGHQLEPITTRLEMYKERAPGLLKSARNGRVSELLTGEKVVLDCGERRLTVDWSQRGEDHRLAQWS